tara:strand:+ start:212 stop:532 length:321 start_codon:yes stop_codon:yes gene_type:complete
MKKTETICIICFLIFLSSCQSLKDGLTGKKKENSDEFLVEKKNPLEIPPSYGDLPKPNMGEKKNLADSIDEDIEKLIDGVSEEEEKNITSNDKSAEDFVLREIKNN